STRGFASAHLDRNEDLLALALHEQRDALRLSGHDALDLLDRLHRLAVDGNQHVPGLDAGALGRPFDTLDDETAVDLRLALLVAGQRPQRQPERAALGRG